MWWATIVTSVLRTLTAIGMSLLTEAFIKRALIVALEKLAKKTQTDTDDKLVQAAKETWGMQ